MFALRRCLGSTSSGGLFRDTRDWIPSAASARACHRPHGYALRETDAGRGAAAYITRRRQGTDSATVAAAMLPKAPRVPRKLSCGDARESRVAGSVGHAALSCRAFARCRRAVGVLTNSPLRFAGIYAHNLSETKCSLNTSCSPTRPLFSFEAWL